MFNRPEAVVEVVDGGAAQAPPLKLKPDRKYPVRSSTVLVTFGVDCVTIFLSDLISSDNQVQL